jgi:3-oxoacyl-[acyl-carrier-protein] synthase II
MNQVSVERIAVTGLGMVTCLGRNATETFQRLIAGEVGLAVSETNLGISYARYPVAAVSSAQLDVSKTLDYSFARCERLAYQAACEALVHAGSYEQPTELVIGETAGTSREAVLDYAGANEDDIGPFLRRMVVEPLGATGRRLRKALPQLVSDVVVCSACSSGALAIAIGAMRLEQGAALPQLVGGADALNALTLIGFGSLGALSNEPCRPFDARRQGLNLGEGAAFLLLETESMVRARGARVLAWLDGYALGSEAHHLTHPEADGVRASGLITEAMSRAGLGIGDLGYINAHGTATVANDAMESKAIHRVFDAATERVRVSSSKGQLGHTLGAAGAIEAGIVVEALLQQVLPPSAGLTEIASDCPLSFVAGTGEPVSFDAALSTSFGFGGAGAVLALKSASCARRAHLVSRITPRVFVKTVVTLGAAGILRGIDNAALVESSTGLVSQRLPFEPLDLLVMERSRRFDRMTALTALGTSLALTDVNCSGTKTGLALGNALGNVSRSAEFVRRVRYRGARGAHPAEFPHLLPSAVSGNASIYSGLQGPVFNVSTFGETAESALTLAVTCLRSCSATRMFAGTVEVVDEPVYSTLLSANVLAVDEEPPTEGAAFLLLETENTANATNAVRCELLWCGEARHLPKDTLPPSTGRCEVLWALGDDETALATYLTSMGWDGVPRKTVNARVGSGWHLTGFLYATAAARVLAGVVDRVLVVTDASSGRHLALFAASS